MRIFGLTVVGLLLSACLATQPTPVGVPNATEQCRITKVVDGDTVDLKCGQGVKERVRVVGYDTPEIFSPSCSAENKLGQKAKTRLQQLVRGLPVTRVQRQGTDRYGRVLARIWLGGTNLQEIMVREGLAVSYNGGRRISWCRKLGQS